MTEVGRNTSFSALNPAPPANPTALPQDVPAAFSARKAPQKRKSSLLNIAVMALVVPGLFATVALPAYAFAPAEDTADAEAAVEFMELKENGAQSVNVAADATASALTRDGYTTTSAAEILRAELAASYASFSGASAADYLANPPYPNFDLAAVAAVAQQYEGVPYVYGGADPSGFDCSGLILYVYAQFGVSLPHSVSGIEASGTIIDRAAAVPGDIVTMAGHNGIYLGNGMFIDAPDVGRTVTIRPIFTDDYWIVRIGI